MLTKMKNIRKKIKKPSERMAQGKPQLNFERNSYIKFRDNCDMDGRTDDRRTTDDGQIAIS